MAGEVCHEIMPGDHFVCYPEPYQHPGTAGAGWEPGLVTPGWPFLVGRGLQESWGSTSLGGHTAPAFDPTTLAPLRLWLVWTFSGNSLELISTVRFLGAISAKSLGG